MNNILFSRLIFFRNLKDYKFVPKLTEEKQKEIIHTEHGEMLPEILQTSAEKKTGLEPLRNTLGIK